MPAVNGPSYHYWSHPTCPGQLVSLGAHSESDSVLGTNLLVNDDLADIVNLVPVLVNLVKRDHVTIKRLKLRSYWNGHIQCLGGECFRHFPSFV